VSRFDWNDDAKITTVTEDLSDPSESKVEVKTEAKDEPEKTEVSDDEVENSDDKPDSKPEDDDPVKKEIAAIAFKEREKRRALKTEIAKLREENEKLKSSKDLNPDDFDTFEEYEKAKNEVKPKQVSIDPVVADAIDTLNSRIKKAGYDVDEVTESLADLGSLLRDEMVVSLSDRKDGAALAKWLAENKDTDEAQDALRARTEKGRDRYLDDIAELIKSKPDKPKVNGTKPVETITRLRSGESSQSLDKLSTEDYAARTRANKSNRFDW
jgi:hypothetical protein